MQVKIRPVNNGWYKGEQYEWQPTESVNGKWYHLWSKNILRYPYSDAQLRRVVGIETRYVMNALLQGVPVQVHACYNRETHKLFIMEPNGIHR